MKCTIHKHRKIDLERDAFGVAFCPKCQVNATKNKPKVPYYDDEPIVAVRQKESKMNKWKSTY